MDSTKYNTTACRLLSFFSIKTRIQPFFSFSLRIFVQGSEFLKKFFFYVDFIGIKLKNNIISDYSLFIPSSRTSSSYIIIILHWVRLFSNFVEYGFFPARFFRFQKSHGTSTLVYWINLSGKKISSFILVWDIWATCFVSFNYRTAIK